MHYESEQYSIVYYSLERVLMQIRPYLLDLMLHGGRHIGQFENDNNGRKIKQFDNQAKTL